MSATACGPSAPANRPLPELNLDILGSHLRATSERFRADMPVWMIMNRIATDCEALAALLTLRAQEIENANAAGRQ